MVRGGKTCRGNRRYYNLGIVNNTKEGVVIELGGGRKGLIKGDTIGNAAVAAVREQR